MATSTASRIPNGGVGSGGGESTAASVPSHDDPPSSVSPTTTATNVGGSPQSQNQQGNTAITNLIINYLPQTMSQDEVRSLFGSMGEVESCKLIRDKVTGQSLGYAFVNYRREEDALRALGSLNGLRLQNKTIKVSHARPSNESIKGANLYVSGLPKTLTQPELEELFRPHGCIITSRILSDNVTGLSKGVGFVRFDRKCEAEEAIAKLSGTTPFEGGEPIQVKFANSPATTVQKTVMQMAQAASALLPLTMLQTALTAAPTVAVQPPQVSVSTACGGPIHHTSHLNRFRYSPLAGMPMIAAGGGGGGKASFASAPLPTATTSSSAMDILAANALLQQMMAAAAAQSNMNSFNVSGGLTSTTAAVNPSMFLPTTTGMGSGFSIFVYNLAPEMDDSTLWRLFGPFGAVTSVKAMKDFTTNRCKGYGFVTMANYEEAVAAITSLNGHQLGNRVLQVSFKSLHMPTQ